ncbi:MULTISPECIES: DNA repair protein RecO [unclassified Acinetobacter]|uniref:DNA repair protein RecO n=1 Tax=unclassified Acinetobacter TaxID=196816 RepID=UPI0035B89738
MRNQSLTGYAIHQRPYRERSHILHFFSAECGRVDGVIRQLPPALYHLVSLNATGKRELKNFNQIDLQGSPFYLQQKSLFAGFYLNELLLKLLAVEVPMPNTYQAYELALSQLKNLILDDPKELQLKLILRHFEQVLLNELGYAIDYAYDHRGQPIQADTYYQFVVKQGFMLDLSGKGFLGKELLVLAENEQVNLQNINLFGKLYRQMINDILGNKPLKSRQLWIQHRA